MIFLRMLKHLLPRARAWRATVDKQLRQFLQGLAGTGSDARDFIDEVWLDVFPETTRDLDAWDAQWGLPATTITEQERRDRLSAAWKALGGQSPRYIQDTLQGAGFNVFIHEWWQLPIGELDVFAAECGEVLAECGEPTAECGAVVGTVSTGVVTPRNPFDVLSDAADELKFLLSCDAPAAVCGGVTAICGAATSASGRLLVNLPANITYTIPSDPNDWPFILYIGGPEFGDTAQVSLSRKDEFEALCLKICPAQQWLGLIVEFS